VDVPELWSYCWRAALVRDPVARLVSLYRLCKSNHDAALRGLAHLSAEDCQVAMDHLELATLQHWVLAWCKEFGWNPWRETDGWGRSIIEIPQARWLLSEDGRLLVHRVYRFEEPEVFQAGLEGRIRRPIAWPQTNATPKTIPAEVTPAAEEWAAAHLAEDYERWYS